jgi:serine/threonine-protein kinase
MTPEGRPTNSVGTAAPLLNDRYEVGERVSEGAFFYTHRGRDTHSGKYVAIKVLKPEFAADEAFGGRLLSEAQSAVSLQHPNIAQVHQAWRERGTVVVVTEWVAGINLKDRIRRVAPFPLAVAMDILLACTQALGYAHESGFVHGDVRPDNIIITPDGRVKLTDFGVGPSVVASSRIQLNALPQAAYYLAPEVAEGRAADARTDIYSLGCILYEMLAGEVPFEGETPLAVAAKHLHSPAPSLRQANPSVPNAVDGVAARCMQKDPLKRYLTAAALLQDIQLVRDALRSDQPLTWSPMRAQAESEPLPQKAKPRAQRRAAHEDRDADSGPSAKLLLAVALLGVLMIVVFFGAVMLIMRPPSQVSVPTNLVGMPVDQAVDALQRAQLKPEVRRDFSEKPQGIVFETTPPGGMEIRAGKQVYLYVSAGPEPVKAPDVVGKPLAEARAAIKAAGLVQGDLKEEYSETIEKGQVMAQAPRADESRPKLTPVTLIVSKGPAPLPPPIDLDSSLPDEPADAPPDDAAGGPVPAGDLVARDHVVTVRVPRRNRGPQRVRIVVRNQDGTEDTAYDEIHEAGDELEHTVTTLGDKGTCRIRVYVNDELIKSTDV